MSDQPEAWKCGNEFLPYHRSASHVNPDHRDGWNACFSMAHSRIEADEALMRQALETLEENRTDIARVESAVYMRDYYDASITALRKRLETSNAS